MKNPLMRAMAAGLCAAALGASSSLQAQTDKTPVLHLSFDSVSGSTVINGGSGGPAMNGALNGSATIVTGGKFGNCLSISGANPSAASCRIANAVVPLNVGSGAAWTLAMWIQTYTVGGCYAYQGDGGWAPNNSSFYLNNGNGGGTRAGGVRYGTGWEEGSTDINDGLWHHVVMTCNGSVKTLYLDGNLDAFAAVGYNGDGWTTTAAGAQLWIGGNGYNGDGSANLNGLIDEVYMFNVALSQTDIQSLYFSNTIPIVPVAVTLNPASGYRGQTFTVTATVTPAAGTVTNVTANLSSLGLASAANLVLSSGNVFTNSFTVPTTTNAPIGPANVLATARTDTQPFIGTGGATFTVLARPPTNAIITTQLASITAYQYTEASFYFGTTNDAPNDAPFPMAYAWYTNGVLVSTNPMGPHYTFLTKPTDNTMTVQAVARVADTNFSNLAVTSAVVTLTVIPGPLVYTNVLKLETFANAGRTDVELGNVAGAAQIEKVTAADLNISTVNGGINYVERFSGYFIPPVSSNYVFYICADDDADLLLSTDSTPANKRLVAQETGWSNPDQWVSSAGGSTLGQKRSDLWSPDGGITTPWNTGFALTAGQLYYLEIVQHQGGGGANIAVTYRLFGDVDPVDGTPSLLNSSNNNIALVTWPGTNIQWSLQPRASVSVFEGQSTNFSAVASSDAEMTPYYEWFMVTNGGTFPGTPLTGRVVNATNLTLSLIPVSYGGAQIYCVASTEEGSLSITSSVCTLTVIQSVFEPNFVSEKKWMDVFNIAGAEAGTLGPPTFTCVRAGFEAGLDNPSLFRDSTLQQIGYFVAPSNGNYVFFITSHDGGDLFLSTDQTAAHKRLVAQEAGWTANFGWNSAGGGGSVVSQKRSDSFIPSGASAPPYSNGIPLVANQRYYMEVDHTTSKWGNEQFGVDYRVMDALNNVVGPANGDFPNCNGSVVGMSAIRCTYVAITQQPVSVTVPEGGSAHFSVNGTSDSQYPICSLYGYTVTAPTQKLFGQWYRISGGVTNAIPGATGSSVTVGPLTAADSGAQFYCAVRALGYADNALNPIYSNSQPASVTVVTRTPSLIGHWLSGAASLADSANYVGAGVYDGAIVGGSTYYFTNDVPPGSPPGAQSLYVSGVGVVISNTATGDPGYVVDTFDGNINNQFTTTFWAKGIPGTWNPWVSKYGENGLGWQLRTLGYAPTRPTFTMRGTSGTGGGDPYPSLTTEATQWHYYAGTFDTTTGLRRLYLDGQLALESTGETPYALAPSQHLMLGARDSSGSSFGNYFTGGLFDVRIYNYALTQQQIANIGHSVPMFTSSEIITDGSGNKQIVITFPFGTLLESTNPAGPWTTNSTVSPATNNLVPTKPADFFRLRNP